MTKAITVEVIAAKILEIREEKVMLDRDLAKLYGVSTKALNQAVRRNTKRFPADCVPRTYIERRFNLSSMVLRKR